MRGLLAVCVYAVDGHSTRVGPPHAENFHRAHVGAGGDVLLEKRAQGLSDEKRQRGRQNRRGQGLPASAAAPLPHVDRSKCRRSGQRPGSHQVRPTAWVNDQMAFARTQPPERLGRCRLDLFCGQVAIDVNAMRHRASHDAETRVPRAENVNGGVLQPMVASRLRDQGPI